MHAGFFNTHNDSDKLHLTKESIYLLLSFSVFFQSLKHAGGKMKQMPCQENPAYAAVSRKQKHGK